MTSEWTPTRGQRDARQLLVGLREDPERVLRLVREGRRPHLLLRCCRWSGELLALPVWPSGATEPQSLSWGEAEQAATVGRAEWRPLEWWEATLSPEQRAAAGD